MESSPHRGLPDQEQMLNEIWGFGYHEKPQALLDPCSAQKNQGSEGKDAKLSNFMLFAAAAIMASKSFPRTES